MIPKNLNKKIKGERGQSVMELALILPLLLLLVIGISEFGRAWMTLSILTGAVREGARVASVTPEVLSNQEVVIQIVEDLLGDANLEASYILVRASSDNMIRVTAAIDFMFIPVPFVKAFIGSNIMMVRSASCYYEGYI
jgi:hypothetical protein